jgi:hypothetical protein
MRNNVDLPQPDGPTSTQNSPSAMSMDTPLMMWVWPKYFWTWPMVTDAMEFLSDDTADAWRADGQLLLYAAHFRCVATT